MFIYSQRKCFFLEVDVTDFGNNRLGNDKVFNFFFGDDRNSFGIQNIVFGQIAENNNFVTDGERAGLSIRCGEIDLKNILVDFESQVFGPDGFDNASTASEFGLGSKSFFGSNKIFFDDGFYLVDIK